MFWGISLCFGKRYSQVSENELIITMAALEPRDDAVENQMTCVMLEKQGNEYLLCTLEHGRVMQMPLNLCISKGEEYVLYINGNGVVHLTGYSNETCKISNHGTFPFQEETTEQHQSYVSADDENSNDEGDREEEEVGTDRLLVLDDSEEDNEEEEWEPNVSELEDTFGHEYMYGNRPQTRSKRGKHVNFVEGTLVDDSYVLPQLTMDDESDESDSSENGVNLVESGDENDEEIDDDEIEDLVEDQEAADIQAVLNDGPKKRKKSALVNDRFKRPKTEEVVVKMISNSSPSKKSKKAKKQKMRENSLVEEVNDTEEVDDEMNSSIGRTPMPKKTQNSALKSNSVLMQSPPLSGQSSAKKFGKFSNKLSNGVEYEDTRIGVGPIARQGKVVHVYYTGQFTNGKVFETCGPNEKAYAFRLGRGEVIKGWDAGIEGMRVGGKRKIKVPPPMAYGKKGLGCIPPHSTLIFTVELKAVN